MAVDFTNPHLKPRIKCDRCCLENYSVENLVSSDHEERERGFMCERFVSPPVTISLTFPCNVEIHQVVIDPWLGNQKSSAFQLFTESNNSTMSSLLEDGPIRRTNDVIDLTSQRNHDVIDLTSQRSNDVIDLTTSEAQPVAKRCVPRTSEERVIFVFTNGYYRERKQYKDLVMSRKEFIPGKEIRADIRHRDRKYTTEVSRLSIRIFGTQNNTIPCVKQLAVYGQPSRNCPRNLTKRILSILSVLQQTPVTYRPEIAPRENETETESVQNESTPEGYLDEITFELMSMPILLPSGHNIDQRTLDRFAAEEAIWGRAASDPFTGLPFGQNKALVNTALKARIDQYIVRERIENIGRTIGRAPMDKNSITNREDIPNETVSRKRKLINSISEAGKIQKTSKNISASSNSTNDVFPSPSTSTKDNNDADSPESLLKATFMSCPARKKRRKVLSHDASLEASLDNALGATLRNLPSFTTKESESNDKICSKCSRVLLAHQTYSLITCSHHFCPVCISILGRKCSKCNRQFSTHQVVKINL